MAIKNKKKLIIAIIIPLIVWSIPTQYLPVDSLTTIEHRLVAIFVMAFCFWVLEPIPIFATSILIITLELLTLSDKSLKLFLTEQNMDNFGVVLSYQDIFNTFSSPIIFLFFGGFFLAVSATKYRLDVNLAGILIKPFGKKPAIIMLGVMSVTAIFSMFMSNTATTAMMLSILIPILKNYKEDDPGRMGMLLSIPFSANIGGMGTPIGTPPNAVALKFLLNENTVSFGEWMSFAVPFVVIFLLLVWWILLKLYPFKEEKVVLNIGGGGFLKTPKAITMYVTFLSTILLWIFGDKLGLNSYVTAMLPIAVFCVSKIITAADIKKMHWDILWLVSGGIALGMAMQQTGLSKNIIRSIPFENFSPLLVVAVAMLVAILMATFMNNTATANLLIPLMVTLGLDLESLAVLGGSKMLVILIALSCSVGMSLPVSTPPNSMTYATGLVKQKDMILIGVITGVIGFILLSILLFVLNWVGIF